MNLRYYYPAAYCCGVHAHAQISMKSIGITYTHCTPQSVGDQFWFWNCENLPKELPPFLTELKVNPLDSIGFGLSDDEANEIIKNKKTND